MSGKRNEDEIDTGKQDKQASLSQDKQWMVKANSRILGPFTHEEVVQKLREKRFVPHDEIIAPKTRWKMIRQEEKFRQVVNEIRNRQSTRGDKMSEITSSGSITLTENATESIELNDFRNPSRLIDGIESQTSEGSASQSRDLIKSYASKDDPNVKSKLKKAENAKIIAALSVFIIAGIFTIFRISGSASGGNAAGSFEETFAQAKLAEKNGDYTKAITLYSEARNLKPNDNELLLHIAPLTLIYEKQTLQAGRIFKQILDSDSNPESKKTALLGLGLVALESHELDGAQEYFSKVLLQDPQNPAALFNIGIVNFYKDKFDDADAYISKALEKNPGDGALILSMANVAMAQSQEAKNNKAILEAHEMMKSYLESSRDYRVPILIQDALILDLIGNRYEAARRLEAALDTDPDQADLFVRDWRYYRGLANWEHILDVLKKVLNNIDVNPHMNALIGVVMSQGREKLDGGQNIEKALAQNPKDPLLMALVGWAELKLGKHESATANIKEAALIESNYKFPKLMRAKLYVEENDFDGAQKVWEEAMKMDPKLIEPYYGLAQAAWAKKDKIGTLRWLRQGQAMGPKYIPLLILNSEYERTVKESEE